MLAEAATLPHERASSVEAPGIGTRSRGAVLHAPRILVVDDDQFVRETFAMTLKLEGYDVVTARTGEAAVDRHGVCGRHAGPPAGLTEKVVAPTSRGAIVQQRARMSCAARDRNRS